MTVTASMIVEVENALSPLKGVQLDILRLPRQALEGFEPSQVGTIVGTLVDACVPTLDKLYPNLGGVGLKKAPGILGDREGYPDFEHVSGARLELKMLYVDPAGVKMKSPPTPREPSARITQKVTVKNVDPARDLLFVLVYRLTVLPGAKDKFSPTFIDIGLFPMIDCVKARDHRLVEAGGRWFGDYLHCVINICLPARTVSRNMGIAEDVGRWRDPGESARWRSTTGRAAASGRAPRGRKPWGRGGALSRAEFFLLPESRSSMRKP